MNMKIFMMAICLLILNSCLSNSKKELNNTFYCQNTMWSFENKPESVVQKAQLMKKIGFDGLEGFGYKDFFEQKKALDDEGLGMPVNYVELPIEVNGKLRGNATHEIREMIAESNNGAIIYFYIKSKGFTDDKVLGDQLIVSILQELAEYAAQFGVKLCVYPHVSYYCETTSHSIKLAELVNRKNYGAAMNLCHLLKVEGTEGLDAKIRKYAPHLFAVNICGADEGETKQYGWDRLIQPLGQGSFDTYGVVKSLKDNGYEGVFGVQCYNLKGDVVEVLTQTMETWNSYKRRYAEEQ